MATDKPKIYGTCKAGCRWETIHKQDFEDAQPFVRINPNTDGIYELKKGIKYKIYLCERENIQEIILISNYIK